MSDGYSAIYKYYDSFTGNVDYNRRADFIEGKFIQYRKPEIIVDLGCGTGTLLSILSQKGFDVIGLDSSPEMLQIAMDKNPGQLLLCQEMTNIDLYGTVQGAICMQDTLNHLKNLSELEQAIRRIALFLESGCLFIFDINSEYKHRMVLSDNVYVYENKDAFLVWQNNTNKDLKVRMTLDLFSRLENGRYLRETGYINEIFISESKIKETLDDCGFEVLEKYDGDTLKEVTELTQRLLFIARKK